MAYPVHVWAFPVEEWIEGPPAEMTALYQGQWTVASNDELAGLGRHVAEYIRQAGRDHGVLYAMHCTQPDVCRWLRWWFKWDWWMTSYPGGTATVPPFSYV